MTTQTARAENLSTTSAPAHRIASIDIFRGLTMLVMIFVNDLASVHGLPWWTYHAYAEQDIMTYVDMVFPFFLFIVGMSLPLAVSQRLKRNPSLGLLFWHVLSRSAGLVVLGLILANSGKGDPSRMAINPNAWALLGLSGAVLFWHVPSRDPRKAWISRGLRIAGLALLILAFALFRRTDEDGNAAWIDGSYPEILGLIGYTYLAVAILYIFSRRWAWAPLAWTAGLLTLCTVLSWQQVHLHLPLYLWPIGSGALASIAMAGTVTSVIFFGEHRWGSLPQRMSLAAGFAATSLFAARLLTPLGISKIRATPSWCLYSVGASVLLFAVLYWICDVKRKTKWAEFVHSAGANPLLTYLLPDFYYFIAALAGFTFVDRHFHSGATGVARAAIFTLLILALSTTLSRSRIRLQL
jgi:heparan-alpha-glucosaminide N-acetyltransferase